MTVKEAIELLKTFNCDLPIYTEGCDCVGPSDGIKQDVGNNGELMVLIKRRD